MTVVIRQRNYVYSVNMYFLFRKVYNYFTDFQMKNKCRAYII